MNIKQYLYISILSLTSVMHSIAQEVTFGVPFDFPLYLSGNFGELRSNHFHGGLDFKTQGVTGRKRQICATCVPVVMWM